MSEDSFSWSHIVKQSLLAILSALSLPSTAAPVAAQNVYRWTDPQGHIHFSNAPVSAAKSVDNELPPAASFGGVPGAIPMALLTPREAKQESASSLPTELEPSAEIAGDENPTTPESEETIAGVTQPTSPEANSTTPFLQSVAKDDDDDDEEEDDKDDEDQPKQNLQQGQKKSAPSDDEGDEGEDDEDDEDSNSSNGDDDANDSDAAADETDV
jgi:hypothetical protein